MPLRARPLLYSSSTANRNSALDQKKCARKTQITLCTSRTPVAPPRLAFPTALCVQSVQAPPRRLWLYRNSLTATSSSFRKAVACSLSFREVVCVNFP
jgi:hypothetical protein